jgi:2,4-dienoyl-CoA reductase-like NADH-dependent reductase (Old Yellow Enzyme family)
MTENGRWQFDQPMEIPCGGTKVHFKNRIIRSSLGGRMAYYDGTPNNAFKNFEYHFAKNGVSAIISATISVNPYRHSPLEYPQIDNKKFVGPFRDTVRAVQDFDCRYIMQIGDCGYHCQTSLFSNPAESGSSSAGFDFLYGFQNFRTEMSKEDINQEIQYFGEAAARVRATGCDGLELTAAKGYLIHQFLNPVINRRHDEYGADRFLLLQKIVEKIRKEVGRDFLFGVRISAQDYSNRPLNLRWPVGGFGNRLEETIAYGRRLKDLGVDFLHVTNGFGFPCPNDNPGEFPLEELAMFCDSTRHLSTKAAIRATLMHTPFKYLAKVGWKKLPPASKLPDALALKQAVGLPVIVNGGFQERLLIEDALSKGCDFVSIGRPLLANPDLVQILRHCDKPVNPCTFCNRCDLRTSLFPVGCYDVTRFGGDYGKMEHQIIATSGNPNWPHPEECVQDVCISQAMMPAAAAAPRRRNNPMKMFAFGLGVAVASVAAAKLVWRGRR